MRSPQHYILCIVPLLASDAYSLFASSGESFSFWVSSVTELGRVFASKFVLPYLIIT